MCVCERESLLERVQRLYIPKSCKGKYLPTTDLDLNWDPFFRPCCDSLDDTNQDQAGGPSPQHISPVGLRVSGLGLISFWKFRVQGFESASIVPGRAW